MIEVHEEARTEIVRTVADALEVDELPPGLRIAIRGWLAMVEEMVLHWLDGRPVPRADLVAYLQRAATTLLPEAAALRTAE